MPPARELNSIRIMIADEESSFRETLHAYLAPESDLTVVGEASDAAEIVVSAGKLKPDVLLVDATILKSLNGRGETPSGISILATIPRLDRAVIIQAFVHGAKAVVPKSSNTRDWPESIRTVVAGQYWLGRESLAILVLALRDYFSERNGAKSPEDYKLTPREVEIIDKIANGHSNRAVSQAFSIQERTVKHHLTNIFTKLGVTSRLELALFAVNHRLLETRFTSEASPVGDFGLAKSEDCID
jgi:DNA-binding NarL/FixJ family response regulator